MGLNNKWALQLMRETGTTLEQMAAAAVKAFDHAGRNPLAQIQQRSVTVEEVLASPQVAGVLTRLMCSSFTDGAAALVLGGPEVEAPAAAPRIVGSVARSGNGLIDYHERLAQTAQVAWDVFGWGPGDVDIVELHDATAPEEIFALESLGFFGAGEAGPATAAGVTRFDSPGLVVNPSGGLVGRGHPLGATGLSQVVEFATQLRGQAGDRQVREAQLGVAVNTGGIIYGDAGIVCIHGRPRRDGRVRGIRVTGWGIAVPDKVVTNDDFAVRLDTSDEWIVERTGIRERRIGGTTSGLAIEAAQAALASRRPHGRRDRQPAARHDDARRPGPGHRPTVQHGIGMRGGAVDLNAACSGFVYGLVAAAGLIAVGSGPGAPHRLRDAVAHHGHGRPQDRHPRRRRRRRRAWSNRSTARARLLSWNLHSDGSLRHLLKCEHGATLYMDGKEVYRRAIRVVVESAERPWPTPGSVPTTSP